MNCEAYRLGHGRAARKLNHLPHSLLDYHDVSHDSEPPAERNARERGDSGRPR